MSDKPNIFILSADSLPYSYFENALSKISKKTKAVEFSNAVAPGSNTSSSMPALAAGVYTDRLTTWGLPKSGEITTLAESLTTSGYSSSLWTDNYLFGKEYNYDRGFTGGNQGSPTWKKKAANIVQESPVSQFFGIFEWAYFNTFQKIKNSTVGGESFYRSAEDLNKNAKAWLNSTDNPKFCWIHYMDTHHPYEPPEEYLWEESYNNSWSRSELAQFTRDTIKSNGDGVSNEELEDVISAFRASCKYLEDQVNQFIKSLIDDGHFDPEKDVFVFMADHGECLSPNKYGMMGHSPATFWEEIIHVPLAISRPDWDRNKMDGQVSLIDVFPTILDAAGVPIPDTVEGQTAASPNDLEREIITGISDWHGYESGEVLTYRLARHRNGWKMFGSRGDGRNEFVLSRYGRQNGSKDEIEYISPNLQNPDDPKKEAHWEELLNHITSRGPPIEGKGISIESKNVDREHLRNLGYLE